MLIPKILRFCSFGGESCNRHFSFARFGAAIFKNDIPIDSAQHLAPTVNDFGRETKIGKVRPPSVGGFVRAQHDAYRLFLFEQRIGNRRTRLSGCAKKYKHKFSLNLKCPVLCRVDVFSCSPDLKFDCQSSLRA